MSGFRASLWRTRDVWHRHGFALIFAALCCIALARVAWMIPFMLDPAQGHHAVNAPTRTFPDTGPSTPFYQHHSCLSAYMLAAELVEKAPREIYDREPLPSAEEMAQWAIIGKELAAFYPPTFLTSQPGGARGQSTTFRETEKYFGIDAFLYPPTFLLLAVPLRYLGDGFIGARPLLFALTLAAMVALIVGAAKWCGNTWPRSPLWLLPIALIADAPLASLQVGNVHPLILILTLASCLAFSRQRHWLGGGLLGFACVAKVFPALFVLYLIGQRQWRSVLTTSIWTVLFTGLAILWFGWQPFDVFLFNLLPKLLDGSAFDWAFAWDMAKAMNIGIWSPPYQLARIGVPIDAAVVTPWVSRVYSLGLVIITLWVGHQVRVNNPSNLGKWSIWIGLLALAQARSPFLPAFYGSICALWLLTTAGTDWLRPGWRWIGLSVVLAGVCQCVNFPVAFGPPDFGWDCFVGLVVALTVIAVATAVVIYYGKERAVAIGVPMAVDEQNAANSVAPQILAS